MRRSRRFVIVTVLVVVGLAPPSSADSLPRPAERWIEVETENFTFFSNAPGKTTRRIAADLEELRAVLAHLTDLELTSPVPTSIYIFKTDRSYTPYKTLYDGRPASVSGSFMARSSGNYITLNGDARHDASAIVYHEYVHYFASTNLPGLPLWFEEGLAELYQGFDVVDDRVRLGLIIPSHIYRLRSSARIPIEELMAVDHSSPYYNESSRKGTFYAQSWALVHYLLIGDPDRRPETREFVRLVTDGVPPSEAFREAFTVEPQTLEDELKLYIDRKVFPYLESRASIEVDTEIAVARMAYPDVLYRLGDLLQEQMTPRPEAATHFAAAVNADPVHGPSIAGLARVAEEAARWNDARELYQRALAVSPNDAMVQYRAGVFLMERGVDPDRARAALLRSTVLDPDFGPAWAALAGAYVASGQSDAEAVRAGRAAHRLLPSRLDVSYNLLKILLRGNLRAEAVEMASYGFPVEAIERERAFAMIANFDLARARERVLDGDPEGAELALRAAESAVGEAAGRRQLAAEIAQVESYIAEQRTTERYNRAVALYNRGEVAAARTELMSLQVELTEGAHAEAVASFIEAIDHPEREGLTVEPPLPVFADASPGEIELLNGLLARGDLDGALQLLEDLDQRVDAGRDGWIDLKIRELRIAAEHNRFAEAYNSAVDQFNGGAYGEAERLLEGLLESDLTADQSDSVSRLMADVRAALGK